MFDLRAHNIIRKSDRVWESSSLSLSIPIEGPPAANHTRQCPFVYGALGVAALHHEKGTLEATVTKSFQRPESANLEIIDAAKLSASSHADSTTIAQVCHFY